MKRRSKKRDADYSVLLASLNAYCKGIGTGDAMQLAAVDAPARQVQDEPDLTEVLIYRGYR